MTEPTQTTTTAIAATPEGQSPPADPIVQGRSGRAKFFSAFTFGGLAVLGVLIVLYAWQLPPFASAVESTENALVRGQVTVISPQLSGYVFEVPVQDFQYVKAGELLVRLDDRIYTQRLAQAQASLASQRANLANNRQQKRSAQATLEQRRAAIGSAEAQARKAEADLARSQALITDGSISRSELDVSRAAAAEAKASLAQARAAVRIAEEDVRTVDVNRAALEAAVDNATAALELARIDLANTRVVAPRDGQLGQIGVRLGAWVNSGAQLMALVPETIWVIANFKETQMAHMRIGQSATFTVDALNHARLRGHVLEIAPATGSEFSLLQADNATGNFVKIAQRIPVKIVLDADQPDLPRLRPGMSVVVSVDTSAQAPASAALAP
ncbi:HlyD family secretion protein [Pseudomonas massiliensis]|uniref:HlyD family secretion protein n=1 Tax=Pseudomonas massiliensis TaxID=522492 RepID=UPI00058F159F|nr:HlyD family secretion protein [Pseudomonas massiliensis]